MTTSKSDLTHYFHPQSRAVTTHWMLAELGVPHQQVHIDFPAGANKTSEFTAINPMAKIPVLTEGETLVTETAAICAYLADRFPEKGLAPVPTSLSRGKYYRYLFFPGTTLEPMFTARMMGLSDENAQSTGWGDYERCMTAISAMTPESDWVLGDQFSAADIVFGGMLDFAIHLGWIEAPEENVVSYTRRLKARPAYRETHDADWH